MTSTFSALAFQEKISRLSLSQDSVETLSLWIIQHKACARDAVQVWLDEVKKGSADKRLLLFYLANDILQNGRRRGADMFLEAFQDPLRQAVTLIGGQKIQTSVERMFRIWKERRVYSNAFLKELEMLIEPVRKTQVNEPLPDFKLPLLQDALSEFAKFEAELKVKSSHLSNLRVDISNPTASLSMLKDKSAGGRVSQQFEEASQRLQDYCECLGIEVNERINILDMLKECTIFTAYRLAELQRTSTDYKNLNVSVNDVKKKIDQRLKDLERAHSTATSDPSAKEDITDIGDMEIESDGESQDSQDGAAKPQPTAPRSLMSAAPGMLMAPPMTTYPGQQQQQLPDRASKRGGFVRPPPLPINNYQIQQAIPPPPPPQQQQKQKQLQHTFNRPRFQAPQTRLGRPPPRTDTGGMMRQLPPRQRPPPPQRLQGPNPQMNSFHHVPSPRVGAMHLFRGPVPRPRVPGPPKPSAPNQHKNEPFTIASSPVLYVKPNEEHPPTGTGRESKNVNNEGPPTGNLADSKKSLDDRLKDMMLLNKKFGNAILNEQEVDSTPDRPYSPSAEDAVMDSSVGIVEGPDLEDDRQSIPTPSSDSPSEEVSPGPNMDNPILKALYTSQTSPDHKPASLVPDYDQEDDELSSSDLKNILHQVISSEPTETKIGNPPLGEGRLHPPPVSVVVGDGDQSRKSSKPSEIKITPTLTSLLDEIFPKISKSLMDRKRKQDEGSNDAATKMLRLADTPPKTHLPRPQQVPQFHPRPPFEGVRYPSPFPAGQPVAKPTENFPRPFISYEATRPISNHMMGNRFGRPMGPSFLGVGMQPRVRPYGVYRAPRYRPQHPRYA